ncbi:hypothetical protein EDD27_3284 [Nonomuraea polychroma]|uniref:Uncharacterized protein n=1 Tax=Nonomuraea polychroma TaxID=46176 RepID=A0A438M5X6_9ACTN|nr:hypothetical protein EDD27_3284 [Nonomuraea polychroma]
MGVVGRLFDRLLGLPETTTPDVEVARDLRVPMPDGVTLVADRCRPLGAGSLPVVLVRSPYGKHRGCGGGSVGWVGGEPEAEQVAAPLRLRMVVVGRAAVQDDMVVE